MADREADLLIIGAGIVGLATALEATRRLPGMRVLVVEKEDHVAAHQTGHNSGVIHSGLYYKTGSLKARNCVAGAASMKRFCQEQGIPFEECGKLVVASQSGGSSRGWSNCINAASRTECRDCACSTRNSSARLSRTAVGSRPCRFLRPASWTTPRLRRNMPS